jgi:hypothetical protein
VFASFQTTCLVNLCSWKFSHKQTIQPSLILRILAKAKLALNTKWAMAFPFGITRQILLLLPGWFVRPMSSTSFIHEKKPRLIRDSNSGPLGFKSVMLTIEPLRLSYSDALRISLEFFRNVSHFRNFKIQVCEILSEQLNKTFLYKKAAF